MNRSPARPPSLGELLSTVRGGSKPVAIVLAGHNGSGKSTLWHEKLSPVVKMPLINADRLLMSILPEPVPGGNLVAWASKLRDNDTRWQRLTQTGVSAFQALVTDHKMAFGIETVFSHWAVKPDGSIESKIDLITDLQSKGYLVVLIFVGLASVALSILRVSTRRARGGHSVPLGKLKERFPRTQMAVGRASNVADVTIMFDNSLGTDQAFRIARVQRRSRVLYDCRKSSDPSSRELSVVASPWLGIVSPI